MPSCQRMLVWCAVALLVAACAGNLEAQGRRDQGPGQPGGPPPGGPPPGGGFPGGGFPGGGFPGGGMPGFGGMGMMGGRATELMLLAREDVQKHLELVDDQLDQLNKVREGMDMRSLFGQLRDLSEEERGNKMRELMRAQQQKIDQQIDEILLPHQAERLKQLAMQWQLQGFGGLTNETVAEELGIDEAQREKLRAKARELEQELRKKLMDDLLKELTPAQQAKYKELVGEPFEFAREPFGGFGRGGFGGPGFGGPGIGGPGGGRGGPGAPGGGPPGAGNRGGGGRRGGGN